MLKYTYTVRKSLLRVFVEAARGRGRSVFDVGQIQVATTQYFILRRLSELPAMQN